MQTFQTGIATIGCWVEEHVGLLHILSSRVCFFRPAANLRTDMSSNHAVPEWHNTLTQQSLVL